MAVIASELAIQASASAQDFPRNGKDPMSDSAPIGSRAFNQQKKIDQRKADLATALRENLKKRKQQQRARCLPGAVPEAQSSPAQPLTEPQVFENTNIHQLGDALFEPRVASGQT